MKALKAWLVANGYSLPDDASDADIKAAAKKAMSEDKLDPDKYVELLNTKDAAEDRLSRLGDTIAEKTASAVATALSGPLTALAEAVKSSGTLVADEPPPDKSHREMTDDEFEKFVEARIDAAEAQRKGHRNEWDILSMAVGDDGKANHPRVKKATEHYSGTKSAVKWLDNDRFGRAGQEAYYYLGQFGASSPDSVPIRKTIDYPSQAEYAKAGAWFKWMMRRAGFPISLNEHERHLVLECANTDRFVGAINGDYPGCARKLSEFERKAVLDESGGSGGAEAVPEFFDANIIRTPLLHGELFPLVNVIPMPRGSSVDGFSIGTPTFVSTASGSAVTPFTTTSFVAAYDVTIYPATCAFEWGADFESDATPNFGQAVMDQIGQEALRWLDEQIAIGDGTTEPQGIFTASGTAVTAENGTGGNFTYNDFLNMSFGIDKAARMAYGGNRTVHVMNDTDYKKFRALVTGVTGDERPLFGMGTKDYTLGDWPVRVQNNITIGNIAFANLGAYRLYQRQGLQFLVEDRGRTLRLANTKLLLARMRWGGKIELASTYIAEMQGDIYDDLLAH